MVDQYKDDGDLRPGGLECSVHAPPSWTCKDADFEWGDPFPMGPRSGSVLAQMRFPGHHMAGDVPPSSKGL